MTLHNPTLSKATTLLAQRMVELLASMSDSPQQSLVVFRLVCEPRRHLVSQVRLAVGSLGGDAAVTCAAKRQKRRRKKVQLLFECSSVWEVLPDPSMREDVLFSVFISLSRLGANGDGFARRAAQPVAVPWIPASPR